MQCEIIVTCRVMYQVSQIKRFLRISVTILLRSVFLGHPVYVSMYHVLTREIIFSLFSLIVYSNLFVGLLNSWTNRPHQTWSVIFRASEHGFQAKSFHSACDGAAPSIVIVRLDVNSFKLSIIIYLII